MNLLVFKEILSKLIISKLIIFEILNLNKVNSQNQSNSQISNHYLRKKNSSFYILGSADFISEFNNPFQELFFPKNYIKQ